jgi:hypothetical protein
MGLLHDEKEHGVLGAPFFDECLKRSLALLAKPATTAAKQRDADLHWFRISTLAYASVEGRGIDRLCATEEAADFGTI